VIIDGRNGISCRYDRPSGLFHIAHQLGYRRDPRLLDIGILPDIMAGNIIGIIAQRLIRVLCKECKYPYQPDASERKLPWHFRTS